MGTYYNPRIVTDGLVLALDAGNAKSYPGTGSTWFDLSGNRRNATLINSPSFSGGIFTFDGVNQYASIANNIQFGSISFSIEMVLKVPNTAYEALFSWNGDAFNTDAKGLNARYRSPGNNIEYALNDGSGIATRLQTYPSPLYTFMNLTFVHNFNGVISSYVNGVFSSSVDYTSSGNASFTDTYELVLARDSNDYGNILLSQFKVYNRALSASEVKQNFNAIRGRYGI
jgi:hypothetical protein